MKTKNSARVREIARVVLTEIKLKNLRVAIIGGLIFIQSSFREKIRDQSESQLDKDTRMRVEELQTAIYSGYRKNVKKKTELE